MRRGACGFAWLIMVAACAEGGEAYDSGVVAADARVAADAGALGADARASSDAAAALDAPSADAPAADALSDPDASGAELEAGADAAADAGLADTGTAAVDSGLIADGAVSSDGGDAAVQDAAPADAGGPSPGAACASSADCAAGEVCGDIRVVNNAIETHCVPLNPTGAALGGACTADADCAQGLCLDGVVGECSLVCASAADCPMGYACTGYSYTPGPTTVLLCNRACADDDDCASGNPGNVCSLETYQRPAGGWASDRVCQAPAGPGALGQACSGGNDCMSGLCLTTSRAIGCSSAAMCDPFESCQCPGGAAPPCTAGQTAACVSRLCSRLCDDPTDCPAGQPLSTCRMDIMLGLPDGTTVSVPSCGR